MTNLMNELPVAVHLASGGEARIRKGGQAISLENIASGSFQVTGGTRFRALYSVRTMTGMVLLLGYTSPVTLANASWLAFDKDEIADDVPEGTTVYWATASEGDFLAMAGGEFDSLHV